MSETPHFNPEASGTFQEGPNISFREKDLDLRMRYDKFLMDARESGRRINEYDIKEHPIIEELLDSANNVTKSLLQQMGINDFDGIQPEQVHFVKEKVFNKTQALKALSETKAIAGFAYTVEMGIYIKLFDSAREALRDFGPEILEELETDAYDWAEEQIPSPEAPERHKAETETEFSNRLIAFKKKMAEHGKNVERLAKQFIKQNKEKYAWEWADQDEHKDELVHTLTHEIIHLVGFQRHRVTPDANKGRGFLLYARTGYSYDSERTSDLLQFQCLNEAVVESMAIRAASEYKIDENGNAESVFEYDDAEYSVAGSYEAERQILEKIIHGVAAANSEEQKSVRERIFKGYFSGDMMHLRDIDHVFGSGTLRMYALLDSKSLRDKKVFALVSKYFSDRSASPIQNEQRQKVSAAIKKEIASRKNRKSQ